MRTVVDPQNLRDNRTPNDAFKQRKAPDAMSTLDDLVADAAARYFQTKPGKIIALSKTSLAHSLTQMHRPTQAIHTQGKRLIVLPAGSSHYQSHDLHSKTKCE